MALFFDELDELESSNALAVPPSPKPEAHIRTKLTTPDITEDNLPGTGLPVATPSEYELQVDSRTSTLSLQQARQAQTLLIREYSTREFQERLRRACNRAGSDPDARVAACEQVGLEAQFHLAKQFGFMPTPSGVALMSSSFIMYAEADSEIAHRSSVLQWLLDPSAQLSVPIPQGPAKCVVYATAVVERSNGEIVCQSDVHLNNNIRALKENIFLATRCHWHGQKLFIGDNELFDQVVLSSVMPVAGSVTFTLEFRQPEVVQWLAKLNKGSRVLKDLPADLLSNPEFILPAVQFQAAVLSQADEALRADRDFLMRIIPHCGQALQFAVPEMQSDRQLVLAAVQHDAWALEFAAEPLRADRSIVMAAIQQDAEALQFASADLRTDAEIVLLATQRDPSIVVRVLPELQNDHATVLKAVQQDWRLLRLLTDEMRADRQIVIAAVRQSGFALEHAAPERRAERDIVVLALQNNGDTLRFASPVLWRDPEVLLTAVRQSGMALGIAPVAVQDLNIALAAVRQDKRAFVFVAEQFRSTVASRCGIHVATEGNPWLESGETRSATKEEEEPPTAPASLSEHFATLNLPDTASKDQIRRRYHQLALQYHPDKYAGDALVGTQMFQRVQTAYDVLRTAFDL